MAWTFPMEPITAREQTRRVSLNSVVIPIFPLCLDNVFRARRTYDEAVQALRDNDLDEATDAAHEMLYLLALQKINQPLVELDMAGKLISINIKVKVR